MKQPFDKKVYMRQLHQKVRKDRREWYRKYKTERGCDVCSETDYTKLEFHHPDRHPDNFSISQAMGRISPPLRVMEAEMERCELLCTKHHTELYHPWRSYD